MGISETCSGVELTPLYRRLPRGPHRMSREQVARNQRARLYGAMIESTSQRGYQATTVAQLVALAGVSRRSFYEHFADKEQCFLATHQSILARHRKRLIDVWLRQRDCPNRLHTTCAMLLEDIAAHPKGPRLVLIDSLDIGAGARARMQLTGATFECLVASVLQTAPAASELAGVSSRAIVGGIRQVLAARMLDGRERELASLADEVLDWIHNYRAPTSVRLAARQPLTRARAAASAPSIAGRDQRARALDELMREALRRVAEALEPAGSWPQAVDRAVQALVAQLLAHRQLLRQAFVELFAPSPRVVGPRGRSIEQLGALLTAGAPPPRRAPILAREAVTGAISAVIAGYIAGGRGSRSLGLADQLTYTVLAPFLGARAAVEEIAASQRAPVSG